MGRLHLATLWLTGCSGCHWALVDMDLELLEVIDRYYELVFSPFVDRKYDEFPEADIALVEGAVNTAEHLHLIKVVRKRSRVLVALGDCAVKGNVTALRNAFAARGVLRHVFVELADEFDGLPNQRAELLPRALSVWEVVPVDGRILGCPPPTPVIAHVLKHFALTGKLPRLCGQKFG